MRKTFVLAFAVLLLASCGGKKTTPATIAAAIESKSVTGLFTHASGLTSVSGASCVATELAGDYTCTGTPRYVACAPKSNASTPCASPTAPTAIAIGCYPPKSGSTPACAVQPAQIGTNPFVTPAQRKAAKVATWTCTNVDYEGNPIGPLTISIAKTYGPVQTEPASLTKERARALAQSLRLPLRVSCG